MIARSILVSVLAVWLAACASRPINEPITWVDLESGYRPNLLIPERESNEQSTLFILSFSGGGTRAAAYSYGVLEELKRTEVTVQGEQRRLLDEVDVITGVSGGSFTALSYALYGDRLFEEYEERFLKRNVQSALMWRAANPFNWGKLMSGNYGRSELAADYYDQILFENATYADLLERDGPVAIAVGTDMTIGTRFAFYQYDFDLICSRLDSVELSRAAATSSAVPVVLSPVTFNNYGGSCDYKYPVWVDDILAVEPHERPAGRAIERYKDMARLHDGANRPYLHLVDGGVSDNIGVRGVMDLLEAAFVSSDLMHERGMDVIRKVVVIVVDSHANQPLPWETRERPPGIAQQLLQSSSVPIDQYSFETIELMKDRAAIVDNRRALKVARLQLEGMSEAEAEAAVPKIDVHVMAVNIDRVADPVLRLELQKLPTSFVLADSEVDKLREAAGNVLRQSPEFKALLHTYQAESSD